MTSLVIEEFDAPDTVRRARALEAVRRRAADRLAGRSVWCIAAAPTEEAAAEALERRMDAVREAGVVPHRASLEPAEPLIGLLQRLDAMLRGATMLALPLERGDEDTYSTGGQQADDLIPREVRTGDVVVLHDPIAAALAPAIRERGAHAVWRAPIGHGEGNAAVAWRFLHRERPALDAYVTAWRSTRTAPLGRGRAGVTAYISATRALAAKEAGAATREQPYEELAWTTVLADVVRDDRFERVGGTLHPRPSVPAR